MLLIVLLTNKVAFLCATDKQPEYFMRKQVNLCQRKVTFLEIFSLFRSVTVAYLAYLSQNLKNILNNRGDISQNLENWVKLAT